jgi:hypothetical protein
VLYDRLVNAGGIELRKYKGRFRPEHEANVVIDAALKVIHAEIAKQANVYHAEIYGAGNRHNVLCSCPCWHRAVADVLFALDLPFMEEDISEATDTRETLSP